MNAMLHEREIEFEVKGCGRVGVARCSVEMYMSVDCIFWTCCMQSWDLSCSFEELR